jgi:hypothetical protein
MIVHNNSEAKPAFNTKIRMLSSTIRAKNQALNENIDKVIRILRRNFQIHLFVLKAGFASEWLIFASAFNQGYSTATGLHRATENEIPEY